MAVFYSALEGFQDSAPEVEYYAKDRVEWLPEFPDTERVQTKPGRDWHMAVSHLGECMQPCLGS